MAELASHTAGRCGSPGWQEPRKSLGQQVAQLTEKLRRHEADTWHAMASGVVGVAAGLAHAYAEKDGLSLPPLTVPGTQPAAPAPPPSPPPARAQEAVAQEPRLQIQDGSDEPRERAAERGPPGGQGDMLQ